MSILSWMKFCMKFDCRIKSRITVCPTCLILILLLTLTLVTRFYSIFSKPITWQVSNLYSSRIHTHAHSTGVRPILLSNLTSPIHPEVLHYRPSLTLGEIKLLLQAKLLIFVFIQYCVTYVHAVTDGFFSSHHVTNH